MFVTRTAGIRVLDQLPTTPRASRDRKPSKGAKRSDGAYPFRYVETKPTIGNINVTSVPMLAPFVPCSSDGLPSTKKSTPTVSASHNRRCVPAESVNENAPNQAEQERAEP